MIKFENTEVVGWEAAIRGMRNPKNSWDRSDSFVCDGDCITCRNLFDDESTGGIGCTSNSKNGDFVIGPNDHDLMMRLAKGGSVHAKYARMIAVYADINAPLYWWKEFDTYKVGTVANSCSTMHKLMSKPFEIDDFSFERVVPELQGKPISSLLDAYNTLIEVYLKSEDASNKKEYWYSLIQLLPSSYNQKRTVMLNYEVLAGIYTWRKNHKLDEWHTFCDWIESLPYSELITRPDEKAVTLYADDKVAATICPDSNGPDIPRKSASVESATDSIIRGVNNEFYPCKPDVFKKTYEEVKEDIQ